ncbi:hypothetical protein ABIE77_003867 [Sinorhizobium fredii]
MVGIAELTDFIVEAKASTYVGDGAKLPGLPAGLA